MSAASPLGITGAWTGRFNGQPEELMADGSYPETVTRFRLVLTLRHGKLSGLLTVLNRPQFTTPISNAVCDPDGCGFEVNDEADDEVYTWRVEPHGDKLTGNRNCGHMTPLGIGGCARLFSVRARRISR